MKRPGKKLPTRIEDLSDEERFGMFENAPTHEIIEQLNAVCNDLRDIRDICTKYFSSPEAFEL